MNKHLCALAVYSIGTNVATDHELTDRDLTNGLELYAVHCASCHEVNLEGYDTAARCS